MSNFWRIVNRVLYESDILLIVLDARLIDETRNVELEQKISKLKKKQLLVINKSDLVSIHYLRGVKRSSFELSNSVFLSCRKHLGTAILREKIFEIAKDLPTALVKIGVLGYPNTGKSSVINAMCGRKAASVSPESGHTRSLKLIKMTSHIYFFDTPGVIPFLEKDEVKHALIASKNPAELKNPYMVVNELFRLAETYVEKFYKIKFDKKDDVEAKLSKLAVKFGKLKKGGIPDIETMSLIVIRDWQTGKISLI